MLLARVRTLLRQYETSEDAVFTIGPYTFRPSSKLLLNLDGSKVRLTEKETSILRYLYRAGQRPASRETLLQEVWAYNSGVTTHTLETHIYRLRQKIAGQPSGGSVLLARIRTLLRQYETSEDAVFTIGPYTFRPSLKLLLNPDGSKVRLTEKETSILRYLYRAGQRPVSRETLLQEVWAYNSGVTTHTLETHIYRLRQKIEKDATAPTILVTEAGGYKLMP